MCVCVWGGGGGGKRRGRDRIVKELNEKGSNGQVAGGCTGCREEGQG